MINTELRMWLTRKKEINYSLSIQDSMIIKGIAICLMLWHHVFFNNHEYGKFIFFSSALGKVCVSLFLFISAYGLSIQYEKEQSDLKKTLWQSLHFKNILQFYVKRLLKLYSHFWVIFILFVPIGVFVFDRALSIPYGEKNIAIHLFFDFFGLADFKSYNVTWWFYRLIISLYLLFPLIFVLMRKWNIFILMFCFLLLFYNWFNFHVESYYLFSFALGISFALNRHRITSILNMFHQVRMLFFLLFLLVFTVFCRFKSNILQLQYIDGFITLIIVLIVVLTVRNIQYLRESFIFLGKHSMNIFMIHTFIFYYFFHDPLYSLKNPILIFSVLLLCCMLLSMLIEYGKEKLGFYSLVSKIDTIKI